MFHADVAKVDRDVSCYNGCTRMLQDSVPNISSVFIDVCRKCVYLDVAYVSYICCKCFIGILRMFSSVFTSVSDACFRCFICLQTYVISAASRCFF